MGAIRWAPKGLYSAAIGWGARRVLPRQLRSRVYRAFARRVGADLGEVELPLDAYESLAAFFARKLRSGARPLAPGEETVIAPCDGTVAAAGEAVRGRMIQAKGKEYSLAQLVADDELAAHLDGGSYVTIYLSPADYHRVHCPLDGALAGYAHIPGTLFPVNPLFSRSVDDLMATNERVVFYLDTAVGTVAVVMVAAVGVSNIEVAHDDLETRRLRGRRGPRPRAHPPHRVRNQPARPIARGDELGAFHLGSTTIVIFPPDRVELCPFEVGAPIRFGQELARPASTASLSSRP